MGVGEETGKSLIWRRFSLWVAIGKYKKIQKIQEKRVLKIKPVTRSVAGFCVEKVSKTLKNIVF